MSFVFRCINQDRHHCDHFFNRYVDNYDMGYINDNYLVTPRIDNNLCRQSVIYGSKTFLRHPPGYKGELQNFKLFQTTTKNIHFTAIRGFLERNYYCFLFYFGTILNLYALMCVFEGLSIAMY